MSESTGRFAGYLAEMQARVNRSLAEVLDDYLDGVDDYLAAPIRYACEGGGKRLRPILFLAAYQVSGRSIGNRVERLAMALEIVHSYSLVHDDLPCMDDDDWRRGRPTCHRAFGAQRATLAAAAMVPLASWVLAAEAEALGFAREVCATLVRELSAAAGPSGMVGGQILDLSSEGREIRPEQLRDIHRRKTGALIRESVRLGARVGRIGQHQLDALTAYGDKIGFAFQIADDLLDEAMETASRRGRMRGDQELDKATYPAIHGVERARSKARELAFEAVAALHEADIRSERLEQLALHVIEREH